MRKIKFIYTWIHPNKTVVFHKDFTLEEIGNIYENPELIQ